MTNPIDSLREKYWINVYYDKNPNAPICRLELVNKDNKEERYKYKIWRDKKKDGYGYVDKLDVSKPMDSHNQAKGNAYVNDVVDELNDTIPF